VAIYYRQLTAPKSQSKLCYERRSVGQSVWGLQPDIYYYETVAGLLRWGALSDERTGLPFTIAAGPRQRGQPRVRVWGTRDHSLLSQIRDSPNLEGQVPVFISPRHWVPFLSRHGPRSTEKNSPSIVVELCYHALA
jgi:hypothetical protein